MIPYTLAENAGMNPISIVTELRSEHAMGKVGAGEFVETNSLRAEGGRGEGGGHAHLLLAFVIRSC